MKKTNLLLFWFLQIIGWGIPTVLNTWAKYISNTNLNKNYIISEGFLFFFLGVLSSSLLRFYLKNNVQLTSNSYLKIILSYLFFSVVFSLGFVLIIPIYNTFHANDFKFDKLTLISVFLNSFLFLFFWLLFYVSIKVMMNLRQNKLEKLELKASLKEAELNTLKGQINPHFMFNSLNNIRGLMLEDVPKSREMLTKLSELLRFSLTKNAIDKITIAEELEMVHNYISLSKIQLEDRLEYKESIDIEINKIEIPPMLIQLLVENAIKHGISRQTNGGIVQVEVFQNNNNLFIEVKNTGELIVSKKTTKVGIQNIKKRLFLLYGQEASFDLAQDGNNVFASIIIPLNK